MLGPVFTADLRSHSRRPRIIILRIGFLSVLLCLFILSYSGMPQSIRGKASTLLADFAYQFVLLYMIFQFVFLLLIGPTYVAGAIAEERQRGTLDYLFSSNLNNYEIIIGKYFSRLALLVQFVLIGIPVLALVQLIGGVSLEMMLGQLMGTLGCLASLTALTLFLSVISKQGRDALVRAFLVVMALLIVWFLLLESVRSNFLFQWFDSTTASVLKNIVHSLLYLNPVYISIILREEFRSTGNIDGLPYRWFGWCLVQHLVIASLFIAVSIAIVRRRFLKQVDKTVSRDKQIHAYQKPFVWSRYPLYWKEKYVQGGSWRMFAWVSWFRNVLLPSSSLRTVGGFALVSMLVYVAAMLYFYPTLDVRDSWSRMISIWLVLGTMVCSMLAALMRTASGIAIEKDRETWDALLASPVSTQDILLSRWYGGLLSARWLFLLSLVMVVYLCVALGQGGNRFPYSASGDLSSVFVFGVSNFGYLIFVLGLASYFSLSSASSVRNVMSALTVLLMLNLFPLLVMFFFRGSNSADGLVHIIYWLTEPGSYLVILGIGCVAIIALVIYYKVPRLRWLYSLMRWLGNMLAFNAVLLLCLCGITFAFDAYIPFERLVLFVAPFVLDFVYLAENVIGLYGGYYGGRYYAIHRDSGAMLFIFSSSALFALMGVLLYFWSLRKLRKTCGRVEYSKVQRKAAVAVTT